MSTPDKPKTCDGFIELVQRLDVPQGFMEDRDNQPPPERDLFGDVGEGDKRPDAAVDEMLAFMQAQHASTDIDLKALIDEGRFQDVPDAPDASKKTD